MKRLNLDKMQGRSSKARRAKKIFKRLIPAILITGLFYLLAIFLTSSSGTNTIIKLNPFANPLRSADNRVNVLFLGIAGGTHDGANLTDTIMIASYDLKTNQVYFFSIPRDLWLPELRSKANAVYEIGLSQKNGLGFAKTIMGNILGIPIQYALRVDFRGFVQAVDALGGIEVDVSKSFDDFVYPIAGEEDNLCGLIEKEVDYTAEEAQKLNVAPGKTKVFVLPDGSIATDSAQEDQGVKYFSCRYEHIGFEKGKMQMSGAVALKFVRSRHGTNEEGSDFARSARQEKVIQAIRSKVLSVKTLFSPDKIAELIKTLDKSIDTDISAKDAFEFYKLSGKMEKTHNFTLDDSFKYGLLPDGRNQVLMHPLASDYGGAYVLVSQDDDFSIVHGYVKKILSGEITEYEATSSSRPVK